MSVRKVTVTFDIHVQDACTPGSRLTVDRLRNELSLFNQHLLEAYDETVIDPKVDGKDVYYPTMPSEHFIS